MPRKDETKVSPKAIEKAVKRHMAGERADTLATELKVSRATIFNWTAKYRADTLEQARRGEMTPKELERQDKSALVAQLEALKLENRRLREKVVALMLKSGEI
jgi:transposase